MEKLVRMIKYLNGGVGGGGGGCLSMSADDLKLIKWNLDGSFAVHPDFKSHTIVIITM